MLQREGLYGLAQARCVLECAEDNFLSQVTDEPSGGDVLLGLLFINKEELVQDMTVKSTFTCSSHDPVEFKILQEVVRSNIIRAVAFRRAEFSLFRDPAGVIPKGT